MEFCLANPASSDAMVRSEAPHPISGPCEDLGADAMRASAFTDFNAIEWATISLDRPRVRLGKSARRSAAVLREMI
jgi:hypothetical protein